MKKYPSNFSSDITNVLDAMSMSDNLQVLGSAAVRSQLYYSDYDAYEIVNKKGNIDTVLKELREKFQSNIKKLRSIPNTYIGDIKSGVVECWRVIPKTAMVRDKKLIGYNPAKSRKVIDTLLKNNIISPSEAKEAHSLLPERITIPEFLEAKQKIKFHVIRWSVAEVLLNKKKLRDDDIVTLEDCFHSPGITKLDVISFTNKYTEFSCIYEFKCNGKVLNPESIDIKTSLEESILAYLSEGNYFKVLKRIFALSKLNEDTKMMEKLNPILNSSLGLLNLIVNDIDTILSMDKKSLKLVRYEIDQFINRLSNVSTDYIKHDSHIMNEIHHILRLEHPDEPLKKLRDELDNIVQKNSKLIVQEISNY